MIETDLPPGVEILPLEMHRDERGWVSEVFRRDRARGPGPCQWNATVSRPNVMRGMHVHAKHNDYLVVVQGRMSVGLFDIRKDSPWYRRGTIVTLSGDDLSALVTPTGVMHGFYCHEPTVYVYGVDAYFDPRDEIGCHWADPGLKLDWPCADPILSERDRRAGTLAEVEAQYRAAGADR